MIFFGTPQFAVTILEKLHAHGVIPDAIVTAPDAPKGRGLLLSPSPVRLWAEAHAIPLITPVSLSEPALISFLKDHNPDVFVLAAYGKIIPQALLAIPTKGIVNVHPSLLPLHRGASPIEAQILADDEHAVGVSIMLLDEKMDHGPLLAQEQVLVSWPPTRDTLQTLLAERGGELLVRTLPHWLAGTITPTPQDDTVATYCKKIEKSDMEIHLDDAPRKNFLKSRAYARPYFLKDGKRFVITDAAYTDNAFIIKKVIPEGGVEVSW